MSREIATADRRPLQEVLDFVRSRPTMVLTTFRRDGSLQSSPVNSDWDEYRQAMIDQGKSLIRITIDRTGPIATGGLPTRLADKD